MHKTIPSTPVIPSAENNKKKFAFLSTTTIPDYRPKDDISSYLEKSQKTTTNQNTKFQQLQQKFGNVANNTVSNHKDEDIPLFKQISSIDNINIEEVREFA